MKRAIILILVITLSLVSACTCFAVAKTVVATGYSWSAQGGSGYSNVSYNDPHYSDTYYGRHETTTDKMSKAIDRNSVITVGGKDRGIYSMSS